LLEINISTGSDIHPFSQHCPWVREVSQFTDHQSELVKIRDCTGMNIMMDARPIYPQGWQIVVKEFAFDGVTYVTDHPVKYYFINHLIRSPQVKNNDASDKQKVVGPSCIYMPAARPRHPFHC
jgi:hypothetical protein